MEMVSGTTQLPYNQVIFHRSHSAIKQRLLYWIKVPNAGTLPSSAAVSSVTVFHKVHDIYFPTVRFAVLDPNRLQLALTSRVSPAVAGTL